MPRFANFVPQGVIPAVLLPFKEDFSIDADAFKSHLLDVGGVTGVTALTLNAHSTEVSSCSFDEQRRVLELALDAVGERLPIVNGVYADGSLEAQRIARMGRARYPGPAPAEALGGGCQPARHSRGEGEGLAQVAGPEGDVR